MDHGPESAALGKEARGHFPQPFQFSTKAVQNGGFLSYPVARGRDLKALMPLIFLKALMPLKK